MRSSVKKSFKHLQSEGTPRVKGIPLCKKYIYQIREGKKTVEGRIYKSVFRNIEEGDLVRFFYYCNASDNVVCKIERVTKYQTFSDMLTTEGTSSCIPGISNVSVGVEAYMKIPGYSHKEKQFGVVAFKLQVVK